MSSTAVPQRAAYKRTLTADSAPSTIPNTPDDSPTASASSTSLSSLGSVEEYHGKSLVDTYGNEFELPNYTIKDIRDAIPKHCFERSGLRGLGYVARDFISLATTFALFNKFCTPEYVPSYALRVVGWTLYTVLQGMFGTGVWILAHECGHQAFSPSKTLNDAVGWFCHSFLLVPYFSWKISHSKHHKATGNMERDMVFVPKTRDERAKASSWSTHDMHELLEEAPLYTAGFLIGQQVFGWPMYLLKNVTGHNNHHKQKEGKGVGKTNGDWYVNHFLTASPLYEKKDEHLILLSDLGLLIMGTALYLVGSTYGFQSLLVWYIIPYLWVNHWLVAITYLQHTDPSLPHYSGETWNFARGAAATIDREFGFIGRTLMHGIVETHVLHHYISTIPFYHADEATEAIKPIMGRHYRSDTKNGSIGFLQSLYKSARWCQWVEPNEGATGEGKNVYFFRNRNGHGVAPARDPIPSGKKTMMVEAEDSE